MKLLYVLTRPETTVYRKPTNNGIYLHWNSFAPSTWKRGTLRSIITRAYNVCSNDEFLKQELSKIKTDLLKINGYPKWVFDQIHQKVIEHREVSTEISKNVENNSSESTNNNTNKVHIISLPYKGEKGKTLMKSLNNTLVNVLPKGHTTKIIYSGKKLGSYFNIKDQTKIQHQNDLIYYTECPENDCLENYVGETERRLQERVDEHGGKDNKSHVLKYTYESGHKGVSINDFKALIKGFKNHKMKRKISEALFIKKIQPTLNKQENSVSLILFN